MGIPAHRALVLLAAAAWLTACAQEAPPAAETPAAAEATPPAGIPAGLFAAIPEGMPELPGNPITPEKVELGRFLYFEPRLSSSWLISCNTCHNVGLAGVDLMETSVGHGWQKGPRNAPTVLNAVYNIAQFWDGRAEDLKEQAKGPVQESVEMNNEPDRVVATLKSMPEYVNMFTAAFPGEADPVSFDNMAAAIEAFEATLRTPGAPFDRYLSGDAAALSAEAVQGVQTFVQKGCTACHNGMNVGGQGYFPFGMVNRPDADVLPPEDKGRFQLTRTDGDEYVFRAPSLRNVALTPPYFHSGKIWELDAAVALMGDAQLGATLNPEEIGLIVAFLHSLTGQQPEVEHPVLPPFTATTPRPELGVPAGG